MASSKKQQNIQASSGAKLADYEAKQAQAKAAVIRNKTDNKKAVLVGVAALGPEGIERDVVRRASRMISRAQHGAETGLTRAPGPRRRLAGPLK